MTTSGVYGASINIGGGSWGSSSMITGPDGNLWLAIAGHNSVRKITLAGNITIIPLQGASVPVGLTAGPDGNIWISESATNTLARVTPGGTVTEWTGSAIGINSSASPIGITTGPDGNIWFAESGSNSVAKFVL